MLQACRPGPGTTQGQIGCLDKGDSLSLAAPLMRNRIEALIRNPSTALLLQAMFLRIGRYRSDAESTGRLAASANPTRLQPPTFCCAAISRMASSDNALRFSGRRV